MIHRSLDSIFDPTTIAVVGASDQPHSVGGAVFQNLRNSPFRERLFAVNRKHPVVAGVSAFPSLASLPEVPDLVVVCTPAPTVPGLAREFGQLGGRGMIVISAGFREAGPAGRLIEEELKSVRNEFPDLRMIGPNCLGALRPANGLNASFSPVMALPGGLAFLSQSGALVTGILDWSVERKVGFSACVSTGNMLDVGMGDLIDYFAADDQTQALLLYIEGLDDPRHFMAAARACTRKKPVLAYKSGRFAESSQAAASHTGAIASRDDVYNSAFKRAGIERVDSIEELFDCARLLVGQSHSSGDRLAIVTNAGGPGVMACDAWLARRGRLAKLDSATIEKLDQLLPTCWSHGNPLDVLGDATADRYRIAIEASLSDPGVDSVLVILTPQTMTEPDLIAEVVVQAKQHSSKPIVASWIGGPAVEAGRLRLKRAGIPVYDFPEEAVDALSHLASSGRLRESAMIYLPTTVPVTRTTEQQRIPQESDRTTWRQQLKEAKGLLGEVQSKRLLASYGIPVVSTVVAQSADEAVQIADGMKYPVVLKILSPDISHKTDAGGVMLNLANSAAVRSGYEQMLATVSRRFPEARIEGVAIQRMISAAGGVEILLGMTRDPRFGPVILLGAGGVTTELQRDSVLELPPMDDHRIDSMLRSLRLFPLLEGYRGRPGVNLPQLREVVGRFIELVEDFPEISTAEINPLLVTADEVVALDARVVSSGNADASGPIAICPYPTDWRLNVILRNGVEVSIRPTHPGDEASLSAWVQRPATRQWLENSATTWWADFTRFPERGCYLDYDHEVVLIARDHWGNWLGTAFLQKGQTQSGDEGPLSRAAMDIFVVEDHRELGLGSRLFQACCDIARKWDVSVIDVRCAGVDSTTATWLLNRGFANPVTPGNFEFRFSSQ
ncbi:MAG: GNAT family N-acetyltransferase [Planctomycetota bacterium]